MINPDLVGPLVQQHRPTALARALPARWTLATRTTQARLVRVGGGIHSYNLEGMTSVEHPPCRRKLTMFCLAVAELSASVTKLPEGPYVVPATSRRKRLHR